MQGPDRIARLNLSALVVDKARDVHVLEGAAGVNGDERTGQTAVEWLRRRLRKPVAGHLPFTVSVPLSFTKTVGLPIVPSTDNSPRDTSMTPPNWIFPVV